MCSREKVRLATVDVVIEHGRRRVFMPLEDVCEEVNSRCRCDNILEVVTDSRDLFFIDELVYPTPYAIDSYLSSMGISVKAGLDGGENNRGAYVQNIMKYILCRKNLEARIESVAIYIDQKGQICVRLRPNTLQIDRAGKEVTVNIDPETEEIELCSVNLRNIMEVL